MAPTAHQWSPITDLPADWEVRLADQQTLAMVQAWQEQAGELREKQLYRDFLARLQRQWSIETGVIEGEYSLSEGATTALIEKGLDAALISHDDTPDNPNLVILKIGDNQDAINGLYQFVSGNRPLGTSYVRELHATVTRHQDAYRARDSLGNWVQRDLPRGVWKTISNSVVHADGSKFEYCPPEHVAQEMDNLLDWHGAHEDLNVPPHVESAWLHHRFSLIHPFTDGNGRVARCLATLVLLKAHWLPLVITRHIRADYIAALREADAGDLAPLVSLFGALQRKAIREAFALSEDVIEGQGAIIDILTAAQEKLSGRRTASNELAIVIAGQLHEMAHDRLKQVAMDVNQNISAVDSKYNAYAYQGLNDDPEKARHHRFQIVECANQLKYYANLSGYKSWTALCIETDQRAEILFSFHGIGSQPYGLLGCSAMFFTKNDATREIAGIKALTNGPFDFTYADDKEDVARRFALWLERCVVAGLDEWRKSV